MGDTVGNFEEEIRGLQEEIRIVEQELEKLTEQIGTCSTLDMEAHLWRESQLLRRKGNCQEELHRREKELERELFRRKEEYLREQILQDRVGCTDFDWLTQDLPPWDSGRLSRTPSTTQKEHMYTLRVEYWDVVKDIEDYLRKANKSKRKYRTLDNGTLDNSIFTGGARNPKHVISVFVSSTCNYLSEKRSGSSVKYIPEVNLELPPGPLAEGRNSRKPDGSKAEDRDYRKCVFYAQPSRVDVSVQSNGEKVTVFELKNGGLGCPVPIYKLWSRWIAHVGQAPTTTAGAIPTSRKDMPGVF